MAVTRVPREPGAFVLALRTALSSPAASLVAVLVVAAVAFAGAAAPGLLRTGEAATLQHALESAPSQQLDLTASTRGVPLLAPGGSDAAKDLPEELRPSWGYVMDELSALARNEMDPVLSDVLGYPRAIVQLDEVPVSPDPRPGTAATLRLTADPRFDSRVEIVAGSLPGAVVEGEPVDIALSEQVVEQTGWELDEVRDLYFSSEMQVPVRLSGIVRPLDAADPDWQHVPSLLRADEQDDGLGNITYRAAAAVDAGSLEALAPFASSYAATQTWYPFLADRVDAADAAELTGALRSFLAEFHVITVTSTGFEFGYPTRADFASTAPAVLSASTDRIAAVDAVMAVAVSGPLAVAAVVLVLSARLVAMRRRTSLVLSAARGASITRLAVSTAAEGAVIGALGAVIGATVGVLWAGGTEVSWVIPVLAAAVPAVALPVIAIGVARRRGRVEARRRLGRVRVGLDLGVIALALAAVILALASPPTGAGSDPLVVILPVLLAAAGCVVVLRITPFVLRTLTRAARRTRGVVTLLGPARAEREPSVGVAPALAVVVGTAVVVFASGILATVSGGIEQVARAEAGSDIRISAAYLSPTTLDALAAIDGVEATAVVHDEAHVEAQFATGDTSLTVYVVDMDQLRAVGIESNGAELPDSLTGDGGTVAVIASQSIADRAAGSLTIDGTPVDAAATWPNTSPFGSSERWIAVDSARASELTYVTEAPTVVLVAVEPGADPDVVAETARGIAGQTSQVVTPSQLAERVRSDPSIATLAGGLSAVVGTVAVLLVLALAMTLVLGSASRSRLFALLGALAASARDRRSLVAWEVAPVVVLAVPVGVVVGLLLTPVVVAALDLSVFTAGSEAPAVAFGGLVTLALIGAVLVATALAVALASLLARRTSTSRTLRTIDEEG